MVNVGDNIKRIRLDKCMTQSQLSGEFITRNMISRIENNAAVPSLPTLVYIAKKLNVPAGLLISDEDDEKVYKKIYNMENIKLAYKKQDYGICRDLCISCDYSDDELNYLIALCDSMLAKESFNEGYLHKAVNMFEESKDYADKTVYPTDFIIDEAVVYLNYLKKISNSLTSNVIETDNYDTLYLKDDFCRYAVCIDLMESDPDNVSGTPLPACSLYSDHINAKKMIKQKDYMNAEKVLMTIINSNEALPEPVVYNIFADIEQCAKENGNYKTAYEYSGNKVTLLERMLSKSGDIS